MMRSLLLTLGICAITCGCKTGGPLAWNKDATANPMIAQVDHQLDQAQTPKPSATTAMVASGPSNIPAQPGVLPVQQTVAKPPNPAAPNTQLVSAKLPAKPKAATLITLPPGASLVEEISQSPGTVLLDFYADWCGPCKTQAKVLHELQSEAARNGARIIKVNVEQHPQVAKQLKIRSLPTLIVMKDGKVVQRKMGLTEESVLASWIRQ